MKLALIQINPRIGDFRHNTDLIIKRCRQAAELGCELAVLPELAACGYPPEDLLERPPFLAAHERAMARLLAEIRGIGVLCGTLLPNPAAGKPLHNAALLFADGEILATAGKRLLPNYDVFDESRYFEPGPPGEIHTFRGRRLAITICEDVWNHLALPPSRPVAVDDPLTRQTAGPAEQSRRPYHHDPVAELLGPSEEATGTTSPPADLLLNIAASPFESGKTARREQIFQAICRRYRIPLVFVNQVGGQDSLIFAGDSLVVGADGQVACRATRFREDLQIFSLPQTGPGGENGDGATTPVAAPATANTMAPNHGACQETAATDSGDRRENIAGGQTTTIIEPGDAGAALPGADHDPEAAEIMAALVLGTGDFVRKCGFSKVILGLSGGLDSALTAVIAARALGGAKVLGLALPSAYSAAASQEDARALAANLGLGYAVLPIDQVLAAYRPALAPLTGNEPLPGLVEQNLQARIRGNLLMAESNRSGRLLLSTGNKSELAVGYCTLYGDMCGALAVLADVPKTMVYRLAALVNREQEIIPRRTIERPPSAELAPDQRDDDDLPPYEVLDPILQAYLEEQRSAAQIIALGFPEPVVSDVIQRIHRNEHKRHQAPPGLKVSAKAFGTGRRYPLTARYDHLARNR
ncbi:NAD+ synthase [Desulfurivibrio dismutans]|uniref:NAD+ synthase n=1 Tax=Desulfurivibrio dismutans TaxID=1398908 RepID=UPI0023DAC043|nr:NAD+ synthase [Desulfurivibrio alkaliphilus]MDF1614003.1 NAD+ synthase [Desulfurivibrio alkaliphilus]